MKTLHKPVPESTIDPAIDARAHDVVGELNVAVSRLASTQFGIVSLADLRRMGAGRGTVEHLIRAGRIFRLHQCVYVVGHQSIPEHGREYAATLAAGPDVYISHYSAARIWGFLPPHDTPVVNVSTVRRRIGKNHADVKAHSTVRLDECDRYRFRDLIPVTSPARTVLDMAGVAKTRTFEAALSESLVSKLCVESDLFEVVARYPHRPGAKRLRRYLLKGRAAPTRSPLERRFLELIHKAGVPDPLVNSKVAGFEVDCYWPVHGVAVELDGRAFHSTDDRIERDMVRDSELAKARISVLRVSWRQVTQDGLATANRLRILMGMESLARLPKASDR